MKRAWALAFVVSLVLACAFAGPAPIASPSAPASFSAPFMTPAPSTLAPGATPTWRPSGSCIFTLDVDNQTASPVTVAVNGAALGNVAAGGFLRLYEMMDGHPPLPWAVVVTRSSDGEALASKYYPEGTLEGQITVRDAPHEPQAVAAGYCP